MHVSFTILYNYDACTSILDLAPGRVRFFYHYIIIKGIYNAITCILTRLRAGFDILIMRVTFTIL